MRPTPYPASEDALLAETFGAEAVEGRTVLCAGAMGDEVADWNVVLLEDAGGGLHLLECVRLAAGGVETDVGPATQARWTAAFERLIASANAVFDLPAWLESGYRLAKTDRAWDLDLEGRMWRRIAGRPDGGAGAAGEAIARDLAAATRAMTDGLDGLRRINTEREAARQSWIDLAIDGGVPALRDPALRVAFGAERLAGRTLVWSFADMHGERPYRACVLMDDDGNADLAETEARPDGGLARAIRPLDAESWRRLTMLAYWRMMVTDDERYAEPVRRSSLIAGAMPGAAPPDLAVMDAIAEAAELRENGIAPN